MSQPITKTFQYGPNQVTLTANKVARQADAGVLIDVDGTVLLATVVYAKKAPDAHQDFFPLRVDYQEKAFAAGKVPGGYNKREGRPSEREILISRLIDRPVRPLFPKSFTQEVQIIVTLLSYNPDVDPEIPAILGASAALAISGLPVTSHLAAAKVGYINDNFVLNPSAKELVDSKLDLVMAGTEHAPLMIESEARELSEAIMLDAVFFGQKNLELAINGIKEFAALVAKPKLDWQPQEIDAELVKQVHARAASPLKEAYQVKDKVQRQSKIEQCSENTLQDLIANAGDEAGSREIIVKSLLKELQKNIVRERILNEHIRIDGRDQYTVRNLAIEVGILPRTHGSSLFTRGETQSLAVVTLGTEKDAQMMDSVTGNKADRFLFHYNFPPYCVGEIAQIATKRREIGHGNLAKSGVKEVLPDLEKFPYVIRVVSEITESNGSSSMASVCSASLALMDAGVPIRKPVSGIAMGLIKEGERYEVLTDILGDEDFLGDMDFKVAGTEDGITALQMDIKIEGINREIMAVALNQAREGRLHILAEMNKIIATPRVNISDWAPRILTMRVEVDKIRDIIGKGGVTIRNIIEETGATIDISEDGVVKIAAVDRNAGLRAKERIELLTADPEVGKTYKGKVIKIVEFGAFVNFLPGKDGLVHISQLAEGRVAKVTDVLAEGQEVRVKVIEVDKQGRIRLSIKDVEKE